MSMRHLPMLVLASSIALFYTAHASAKELTAADIPAPVLEAFAKVQPAAKVKEYRHITRHGQSVYEIEYEERGLEYQYIYTAEGQLLERDEGIKLSALPEPVADTIKRVYPEATLSEAAKNLLRDGRMSGYKVELKRNGKGRDMELVIDPNGNIIRSRAE